MALQDYLVNLEVHFLSRLVGKMELVMVEFHYIDPVLTVQLKAAPPSPKTDSYHVHSPFAFFILCCMLCVVCMLYVACHTLPAVRCV